MKVQNHHNHVLLAVLAISAAASSITTASAQDCSGAYVYCPNRSTCFQDVAFNNGNPPIDDGEGNDGGSISGWSIEYDGSEVLDDCQIWMNVIDCDFSTGIQVGTATLSANMFHYCLDLNGYESDAFQLYAGTCEASDGGAHVFNGGVCVDTTIAEMATVVSEYTMVAELEHKNDIFTFDLGDDINTAFWGNDYQVFPIESLIHLVGHVEVCPLDDDFISGGDPEPTTVSPTTERLPEDCRSAFVYCPGRSTCFLDGNDLYNNGGVPISHDGEPVFGWTISYDAIVDGLVDDCKIYMDVQGCDITTGIQVGTAYFNRNMFHYCLDMDTYHTNSFQLYSGPCQGPDGATHVFNGGTCVEAEISEHTMLFNEYTMVASGGPLTDVFTFDVSDDVNTKVWGDNYQVFPIGFDERTNIVAHVDVCPIDVFVPSGTTPSPAKSPTKSPTVSPTVSPTPSPTCTCQAIAEHHPNNTITINFDYCGAVPEPDDWIGIWPCDASTLLADEEWDNQVRYEKVFENAGYTKGEVYVNDMYKWFGYTCGSPDDGCQRNQTTVWPTKGTIVLDPRNDHGVDPSNIHSAYWAFPAGDNLVPGCYKALLSRTSIISAPPFPTVCKTWAEADEFTIFTEI